MLELNARDVEVGCGQAETFRKNLILDGASKIKSIKKRIALHRASKENQNCYVPVERYEDRKTFLKGGHNDNSKAGIAKVINANTD